MGATNEDDPIIQRIGRRAWTYGVDLYGWKSWPDNEFYQMMKVWSMSMLDEFLGNSEGTSVTAGGDPIVFDLVTPPDPANLKMPNDDNDGGFPGA